MKDVKVAGEEVSLGNEDNAHWWQRFLRCESRPCPSLCQLAVSFGNWSYLSLNFGDYSSVWMSTICLYSYCAVNSIGFVLSQGREPSRPDHVTSPFHGERDGEMVCSVYTHDCTFCRYSCLERNKGHKPQPTTLGKKGSFCLTKEFYKQKNIPRGNDPRMWFPGFPCAYKLHTSCDRLAKFQCCSNPCRVWFAEKAGTKSAQREVVIKNLT